MAEVYTVRGGIYEVTALDAGQLVELFRPELARAGFLVTQQPLATPRVTNVQAMQEGAIRRLEISAPPFDPTSQARDTRVPYAEDPARLAEAGRAQLTTFTWNLCGPSGALGTLRDLFRRVKIEGTLKLSPIVTTWSAAPVELSGFPPRPVQPGCEPKRSSGAGAGAAFGLLAALAGLIAVRAARRGG